MPITAEAATDYIKDPKLNTCLESMLSNSICLALSAGTGDKQYATIVFSREGQQGSAREAASPWYIVHDYT